MAATMDTTVVETTVGITAMAAITAAMAVVVTMDTTVVEAKMDTTAVAATMDTMVVEATMGITAMAAMAVVVMAATTNRYTMVRSLIMVDTQTHGATMTGAMTRTTGKNSGILLL